MCGYRIQLFILVWNSEVLCYCIFLRTYYGISPFIIIYDSDTHHLWCSSHVSKCTIVLSGFKPVGHCIARGNKPTGLGPGAMFLYIRIRVHDLYCTVYECSCIVCWLLLQYHTNCGPNHCVLVCICTTLANKFNIDVRKYDSTCLRIYKGRVHVLSKREYVIDELKSEASNCFALLLCVCIYLYIRPSQPETPQ